MADYTFKVACAKRAGQDHYGLPVIITWQHEIQLSDTNRDRALRAANAEATKIHSTREFETRSRGGPAPDPADWYRIIEQQRTDKPQDPTYINSLLWEIYPTRFEEELVETLKQRIAAKLPGETHFDTWRGLSKPRSIHIDDLEEVTTAAVLIRRDGKFDSVDDILAVAEAIKTAYLMLSQDEIQVLRMGFPFHEGTLRTLRNVIADYMPPTQAPD